MQEQGKQAVKSKGNHRQQSSLFQNIENKAPENKQTLFVAGIGALRGKRVKLLLQFPITNTFTDINAVIWSEACVCAKYCKGEG